MVIDGADEGRCSDGMGEYLRNALDARGRADDCSDMADEGDALRIADE